MCLARKGPYYFSIGKAENKTENENKVPVEKNEKSTKERKWSKMKNEFQLIYADERRNKEEEKSTVNHPK